MVTQTATNFRVLLDGQERMYFVTYNEAWTWLLHKQGQSVSYALTYGGWDIQGWDVLTDTWNTLD